MYREKRVFICNCQATFRKALRLNPSCSLLSFSSSYYWSFWNHYLRSGFKSVSLVVVKITERFFVWVFWFWVFFYYFQEFEFWIGFFLQRWFQLWKFVQFVCVVVCWMGGWWLFLGIDLHKNILRWFQYILQDIFKIEIILKHLYLSHCC